MTRVHHSLLTTFLWLSASTVVCAQSQDVIPSEVRRRIAQAMWPENLFDTSGRPEPGSVWRPAQPAFTDLQIRRGAPIAELPGVTFYAGAAYPSGCSHCSTWRHAVAERGGKYVTLLSPEDIQYVAGWAAKAVLADSVRLPNLVLSMLRSTCFLGCDIEQVRSRAAISDASSPRLRAATDEKKDWHMPRTYSWQSEGYNVVEFAIFARGSGVYAARAEWSGGEHVLVSITPVADYFH